MNAGGVITTVLGTETVLSAFRGDWWTAVALVAAAAVVFVMWPAESP